jgi:SPP1 family phage portal protein
MGEGDVKGKLAYITKDQPHEFIKFSAETIERLIYEMLMIVNPNDDSFAASSGIAQAWKTFGMELACASIESYFARFLYNRIYLIDNISRATGVTTEGAMEVQVSFKRNTPVNTVELADVATKLKGILSDETIIKMFPVSIVPDYDEELERLNLGQIPLIEESDEL